MERYVFVKYIEHSIVDEIYLTNCKLDDCYDDFDINSIEYLERDEDDLFYDKNEILDKADIEVIRNIQANRNCIDAFTERRIENKYNLQYSIRFFCFFIGVDDI